MLNSDVKVEKSLRVREKIGEGVGSGKEGDYNVMQERNSQNYFRDVQQFGNRGTSPTVAATHMNHFRWYVSSV